MNILLSLLCATGLMSPASGIAQNAVVYFDNATCPTGYMEATFLRDRSIIGLGTQFNLGDIHLDNTTFGYNITSLPATIPAFPRGYALLPCQKTEPDRTVQIAELNALNRSYSTKIEELALVLDDINATQEEKTSMLAEKMYMLAYNISNSLSTLNGTYYTATEMLWIEIEEAENATLLEAETMAAIQDLANDLSLFNVTQQASFDLLLDQLGKVENATTQVVEALSVQFEALNSSYQELAQASEENKKDKNKFSKKEKSAVIGAAGGGFIVGIFSVGGVLYLIQKCKKVPNIQKKDKGQMEMVESDFAENITKVTTNTNASKLSVAKQSFDHQ